jgi:hypothetical protein
MSIVAENSKMDTSSPKTVPELFLRMLTICCIMLKGGCKEITSFPNVTEIWEFVTSFVTILRRQDYMI